MKRSRYHCWAAAAAAACSCVSCVLGSQCGIQVQAGAQRASEFAVPSGNGRRRLVECCPAHSNSGSHSGGSCAWQLAPALQASATPLPPGGCRAQRGAAWGQSVPPLHHTVAAPLLRCQGREPAAGGAAALHGIEQGQQQVQALNLLLSIGLIQVSRAKPALKPAWVVVAAG